MLSQCKKWKGVNIFDLNLLCWILFKKKLLQYWLFDFFYIWQDEIMKLQGNGKELPVSEMVRKWVEMCQTERRLPSPTKESMLRQTSTSFPLPSNCLLIRVSCVTSFDSKQPKLVSALSETKCLFRFQTQTVSVFRLNRNKKWPTETNRLCMFYKILPHFRNFNAINLKFLWIVDNNVTYNLWKFQTASKLRPSWSKTWKNFRRLKNSSWSQFQSYQPKMFTDCR